MPTADEKHAFLETLWEYYGAHGRHDLPWRQPEPDGRFDAYKVMVSELMLQQTQVPRVMPKYAAFLERFPTVHALASADLGDVLRTWQGLGYNRRAKFLWQAAQMIDNMSHFPDTLEELVKLPGIGHNTAGAIMAYAYDQPAVFVETNVRTVYIHHFLHDRDDVTDKEILNLLQQTIFEGEGKEQPETLALPKPGAMRKTVGLSHVEQPREFYWALMDYGSYLKTQVGNPNKASKHYAKQSQFQGSRRQVRGQVLRALGEQPMELAALQALITDERLESVLNDLVQEGLIRLKGSSYSL
ncbi:MAG: A/G-specific adenine glycosylase [Candidatus Saccharibacteria bacterium]